MSDCKRMSYIKSKIHLYKGKDALKKSLRLEHILHEMFYKGELHNMSQIRLTGIGTITWQDL